MKINLYQPLAPPHVLVPWLAHTLPGYSFSTVAGKVAATRGSWCQILIATRPYGVELETGLPVLPRLLVVFGILGGIVPGLLFAGLYYATASGTNAAIRAQLAAALTGQPIPPGPGTRYAAAGGPHYANMAVVAGPRPPSRYAPLWMPIVAGLLLLLAALPAVALVDGADRYPRAVETVAFNEERDAILSAAVARIDKGEPPPSGCPEQELLRKFPDLAWNSMIGRECHACTLLDGPLQEPPTDPLWKVHERDGELLLCPSADYLRGVLSDRAMLNEWDVDSIAEGRNELAGGGAGVLVLLAASLGLFVGWRRKLKARRAATPA